MRVREAMTENVLTITPGRTLREAARFMKEHNVGALVVMDPEAQGPGIVTERDLVRSLGSGEDPDQECISDHLTSRATFADGEWALEEAADTMARGGFRHLVVIAAATSPGSSRCATSSTSGDRAERCRLGRDLGADPGSALRGALHLEPPVERLEAVRQPAEA